MKKYRERFRIVVFGCVCMITLLLFVRIGVGTVDNSQKLVLKNVLSPGVRVCFFILLVVIISCGYILIFRFLSSAGEKAAVISSLTMAGIMVSVYILILYNIQPFSSSDAYNVQDLALYLAKTGRQQITETSPHGEYFGYYANNYFLTILLSKFFKIMLGIGIKDMYIPLYVLSISGMLFATVFLYLIGYRVNGAQGGAKILAFCAGNPLYYLLPLWAYTNAFSIPFTAAVVYFSVRLFYEKSREDRIFSSVMLAFFMVVGYFIRPTVVIPVIAFLGCLLVEVISGRKELKKIAESIAVILVIAVGVYAGISTINNKYFTEVSEHNIPITHWLMMASHGDGKVDLNDFYYTCSFPTKEEKQKATLNRMKENYGKFTPKSLLTFLDEKLKVSWCYADGDDLLDKISQNRKDTVVYDRILGCRSNLFRGYCYAFRVANIGMILVALWQVLRNKSEDVKQVFYALSFLGGVCFYSIWEIKASYGMPFIMFFLLLGVCGADYLTEKLKETHKEGLLDLKRNRFSGKKIILAVTASCILLLSATQMTEKKLPYFSWNVHCGRIGTVDYIREKGKRVSVDQTFWTSRPFNRIKFMVEKKLDKKRYLDVSLKDDNGKVYLKKEICVKHKTNKKELTVKIPQVKPVKMKRYTLHIVNRENETGDISIFRRREYYLGSYKGTMTINGERQPSRLYLKVLQYSRRPWCSKKISYTFHGMLWVMSMLILWNWPEKKCIRQKKIRKKEL